MPEGDRRIETVAEFRREQLVDRLGVVALALLAGEAIGVLGHVGGAGIGGHDQDDVPEIDLLAIVVGQLAVVHHLQEDVEQVGMGLLDLVEQQHAMRMLVDLVGQQAALVEADIARRRADQPRDGVALHVLRHVEAHELDAERGGELARDLGLADTGRAGEEIAADRLLAVAQAGAGELDRGGQRLDRFLLAVDRALQRGLKVAQHLGIVLGDGLGRDARHRRDRRLDLLDADRLLALGLGHQHLRGAGLVDHVDRLVRQLAVMDVAGRQFHRRLDGVVGVAQLVELLEIGLQPPEDLDRVRHRRFVDVDLLEAPDQCPVLLEILAVFLIGGRADAAQRARGQRRLQQVRGVHRAARGRTGADHRVDLVDEHDRLRVLLDLLHHLLEAFLEIAAIARAGKQRAHVEREDGRVLQHLGHLAAHDLEGQALGDRGLADAGVADQQRVVLLPAAEDLDGALHLGLAADQRIDAPVPRLAVEVDAVSLERAFLFLLVLVGVIGLLAALLALLRLLVGAAHRPALAGAGALGDAVADVVDRVVAGHVLLLQEVGGVALALGEHRHEHVGPGHLLAAGRLDMDHRALDHALEAGGRLGIVAPVGDEVGQFRIDVVDEVAAQRVEIDAAGAHHRGCVLVVDQRQQQVFQRRIFMVAFIGEREGPVKRLFEAAREARQGQRSQSSFERMMFKATFSPSRIAADACACGRGP